MSCTFYQNTLLLSKRCKLERELWMVFQNLEICKIVGIKRFLFLFILNYNPCVVSWKSPLPSPPSCINNISEWVKSRVEMTNRVILHRGWTVNTQHSGIFGDAKHHHQMSISCKYLLIFQILFFNSDSTYGIWVFPSLNQCNPLG